MINVIDRFILKVKKKKSTDRSTHIQHASTQLEKVSKIGRHTYSVCQHSQQKYFKDVDSLEGCVDTVFNIQLTRLMQLYIVLTYFKTKKGENVDTCHECVNTVK